MNERGDWGLGLQRMLRAHMGPLLIPTGALVLAGGDSFLAFYCPIKVQGKGDIRLVE